MAKQFTEDFYMSDIILKMPEVIKRSGLSRAEIYRKMEAGDFPKSVKMGVKSVGWYDSEISSWQKSLRNTQ